MDEYPDEIWIAKDGKRLYWGDASNPRIIAGNPVYVPKSTTYPKELVDELIARIHRKLRKTDVVPDTWEEVFESISAIKAHRGGGE